MLTQISPDEISTPASRHKLFHTLLEKSTKEKGDKSSEPEFSALVKLLKLWPAIADK